MTTTMTGPQQKQQSGRVDDVPAPEVPERARRRTYTAKYKGDVLAEYEAADRAGRGALLRREGLPPARASPPTPRPRLHRTPAKTTDHHAILTGFPTARRAKSRRSTEVRINYFRRSESTACDLYSSVKRRRVDPMMFSFYSENPLTFLRLHRSGHAPGGTRSK
jgi:hypothetical protein